MFKKIVPTLIIFALYFTIRLINLDIIPVFCDEAIYIHWAEKISSNFLHNAFIPLSDGKTPLFMWLMIPLLKVISDPLIAGRILSIISGLATLIGGIYLGRKYFNKRTGIIAGILFTLTPLMVFFDRMALTDSMLAAFSLWSLILSLNITRDPNIKNTLLLGLILGLGILVKTPGLFSFLLLPFILLIYLDRKKRKQPIEKVFLHLGLSAVLGFCIYNLLHLSHDFVKLSPRNEDYYFPISRLWEMPFNPFIGHTLDIYDWFTKLLTWPILLLILISAYLILKNRNWTALVIFLWGSIPLLILMSLLKVFTARYILFSVVPFVFLAGWSLNTIYSMFSFKNKIALFTILIIILLIPAVNLDINLLVNPEKANLPHEERKGYLEDWTAGYGLKDISAYLSNEAAATKILVVTEGAFGTLPDGLQIYLKNNPKIEIWYGTSILDEDVYLTAKEKPTYFIVNKSHESFNRNLTLIKEYPKAKGFNYQDSMRLYKVE